MYNIRHFAIRHARFFERVYELFEAVMIFLHPLFKRIGYKHIARVAVPIEKVVKGALFDTQMCGMCTLSATGMACPMNCPKQMRNGPCGGVRIDGHCEIKPDMVCVWVEAFHGSQRMRKGDSIHILQKPVDYRLKGSSSWLREVRIKTGDISVND